MSLPSLNTDLKGLTAAEVLLSRTTHGENKVEPTRKNKLIAVLKDVLKEPMLILLATASILYFIHGDTAEAVFLLLAIALVFSISSFQESRSEHALEALKKLTQPKCRVIRDHQTQEILGEELVVGDLLMVEEGSLVAADGQVIQSSDFTVNESTLTGESMPVEKNTSADSNLIFQGTLVTSGIGICKVTAVGKNTQVGTIGKRIEEIDTQSSPLQAQISNFIKKMAAVGAIVFVVIWVVNFYHTGSVVDSLLHALTLAMSILPEEIPVAFATFLALGAWRLSQGGIIVKDTRTVETLGSATVIGVDKTGTLTKNEMALEKIYVHDYKKNFSKSDGREVEDMVTTAMWASEPVPFDPMEKSIHAAYEQLHGRDLRPYYKMIKEYPLGGKPPLMTHVFQDGLGDRVIAAKGAPEAILRQSTLTYEEKDSVMQVIHALTSQGYRVLGVGQAPTQNDLPKDQSEFVLTFKGLLAFLDPPKDNITQALSGFYQAGIQVKIITGDNAQTTRAIASQVGFQGLNRFITGEEVMKLQERELDQVVSGVNLYARMFPEAKFRVIQALKRRGEVVAMTGDGVNDGPALKAAHIGVAMGKKGTEIARQASSLIIVDDDLSKMVNAVAMGRKIYGNLKKAIQYIISIHIPIILIVFLPLVLGWIYPVVFSPINVIFLELIMGPTCSIVYENEPLEPNAMRQRPRALSKTFLKLRDLITSIIQGVLITAGLILIYWHAVNSAYSLPQTTAMVFLTLISANVTLTLVNRSFYYSILKTLRYTNRFIPLAIVTTLALTGLIFLIPLSRNFFGFAVPPAQGIILAFVTGFLSVIWFEGYKLLKRHVDDLSEPREEKSSRGMTRILHDQFEGIP